MKSDIPGFYELSVQKRLEVLKENTNLDDKDVDMLKKCGCLDLETADIMIENVIGTTHLPVGVATYFLINGKDRLIPMAIEEPSVVAAASHAAKLCRNTGGFRTSSTEPIMIGQIQLKGVKDGAEEKVKENVEKIRELANHQDSTLIKKGGGLRDVECRRIKTNRGEMMVVHIHVDVRDAMGANAVNTMCESVAPLLEEVTGGKSCVNIISNLADKRLVRAEATWPREALGDELVEGVLDAYAFAAADPYRAATNNKGIMNGIDAVVIATGNDFRAISAGAHAYAARNGRYEPLAHYEKNENGDLVGRIELPMAVGIVGGATNINPVAGVCLKMLGVERGNELAEIAACVGLANNFAAVRAIVKEGIQAGHMRLHATNVAVMAGAKGDEIQHVAEKMTKEKCIRMSRAQEILDEIRKK